MSKWNITSYPTLNAFFIRSINHTINSDPLTIISPADGQLVEYGKIENSTLFQIKGSSYSLNELLRNDGLSEQFINGNYLNIHLRPFDYHRFHMPFSAQVLGYGHIKGTLFPVNQRARKYISKLYTKNERLITILETLHGKVLFIAIGALGVGTIKVRYTENYQNMYHYFDNPLSFNKGNELGHFELGSSILLIFEKDMIRFDPRLPINMELFYGKKIGEITSSQPGLRASRRV